MAVILHVFQNVFLRTAVRRFTPASFIKALLLTEGFLLFSERFHWFAFNQHKGWTPLVCLAVIAAAMLVMLAWFVGARIFKGRFQFNIRTMLALTLAVAIAFGWMASEVQRARRQASLAAEAGKISWGVLYDSDLESDGSILGRTMAAMPSEPRLQQLLGRDFFHEIVVVNGRSETAIQLLKDQASMRRVSMIDAHVTDAGMASLDVFKLLEELDLRFEAPGVTDAGIKHLQHLTRLRKLYLRHTSVSDAGLVYLKDLTKLEELDLAMTHVTDAGLKQLAPLTRLRYLDLYQNKISDEGLTVIGQMSQLETLMLGNASVTDAGLQKLKNLKHLQWLDIGGSRITDAGLGYVEGMRELRQLGLYRTQISDAGLVRLARLARLEELNLLDIRATRITPDGIKKLQQALPGRRITYFDSQAPAVTPPRRTPQSAPVSPPAPTPAAPTPPAEAPTDLFGPAAPAEKPGAMETKSAAQ
jgi:hypothetical protein